MKAYYVYVHGKQIAVTAKSEDDAKAYYESISDNREKVLHVEPIETNELLTATVYNTDSLEGK